MEWVLRLLGGLVPEHTADPEMQYRYLLRLGLTTTTVLVGLVAVVINAFGVFPAWSEGFAHASDVSSLVREIRSNRQQQVDAQLLDLRIKHCQAKTEEARQLYWTKIAPLLSEFQQLTGRPYYLPACTDL